MREPLSNLFNMEYIQYKTKNRRAYITLNRPEKRNALNFEMVKELKVVLGIGIIILVATSCAKEKKESTTHFTKADSLTERYLSLQDSIHHVWNTMIRDDNEKIKTMGSLLHELEVCGQFDPETITSLKQRLEQLSRIRYTPKTMSNLDIIDEYDFASSSLVSELVTLAESHRGYSYSKALQNMVESIEQAELRIENYRQEYDGLAIKYNQFLDENKNHLKEIANNETLAKKPLFQMVSE